MGLTFQTATKSGWEQDDFTLAIIEAYDSTPDTDRGLRDLIVEIAGRNIEKLAESGFFGSALWEVPTFASDMVYALSSKLEKLEKVEKVEKVEEVEKVECPSCIHCHLQQVKAIYLS